MVLEMKSFNIPFSHIYVEQNISDHPITKRILGKYKNANVIKINHYKDVFSRGRQDIVSQRQSQSLILASKTGELIYKGSPMCQDFDNENFYYTSCTMNCIFDCEYCYLKGMYPTSNIVVFVNIEDIFEEVLKLCKEKKIYLCVSYDTDLIALDNLTGFISRWMDFVESEPNLTVEIRTKSHRRDIYERFIPNDRVIFAYTMSPEGVIDNYEHKTASLEDRIKAASFAITKGFTVRLCFDPMIYCKDFEEQYKSMVDKVFEAINPSDIYDVSVGSFRIAGDYLKNMRHKMPESAICQFPFEVNDKICTFPTDIKTRMERHIITCLTQYIDESKIFRANY